MKTSGKYTHPNFAVDPKKFRAQATGTGNTQTSSLLTGSARAQCVVDCMSPVQRNLTPEAAGYPVTQQAEEQDCYTGFADSTFGDSTY